MRGVMKHTRCPTLKKTHTLCSETAATDIGGTSAWEMSAIGAPRGVAGEPLSGTIVLEGDVTTSFIVSARGVEGIMIDKVSSAVMNDSCEELALDSALGAEEYSLKAEGAVDTPISCRSDDSSDRDSSGARRAPAETAASVS